MREFWSPQAEDMKRGLLKNSDVLLRYFLETAPQELIDNYSGGSYLLHDGRSRSSIASVALATLGFPEVALTKRIIYIIASNTDFDRSLFRAACHSCPEVLAIVGDSEVLRQEVRKVNAFFELTWLPAGYSIPKSSNYVVLDATGCYRKTAAAR